MKLFKSIHKTTDLAMLQLGIKKTNVECQHRLLNTTQERELFGKISSGLYRQLPDIVTDTHRYAVSYYIRTFIDTVTTTTTYFKIFKKRSVSEWYKLELTMFGEPVHIIFKPSTPKDTPICVQNNNENRSIRLFKSKDDNLYSDVTKTLNLDHSDVNFKDAHKALSVTVKEIPLNWHKIRYRNVNQKIVSLQEKDRLNMVSEIMVETCQRDLKDKIHRDMRSGQLMRMFTNGEVVNNMLLAYEVEESVIPFIN